MASRLLQKETSAEGYEPPAPVAVAPVAMSLTLPTGTEIPTVLLARHQIEAELVGATPRIVAMKPVQRAMRYLAPFFGFLPMVVPTYNLLTKNPGEWWLWSLPALFLIFSVGVCYYVGKTEKPSENLLRTGFPRSAFVETVAETTGGSGTRKVVYWYADASGGFVSKKIYVVNEKIAKLGIAPGFVFTVLVSETGTETLPYFLADAYKVTPIARTGVSDAVSVRVTQADAVRAAAILRQPGMLGAIEPELLQGSPRVVRATARGFRNQQSDYALFAIILTLYVLCVTYKPSIGLFATWVMISQLLGQIMIRCAVNSGNQQVRPGRFLRHGVPARALVTEEEDTTPHQPDIEKHPVVFRYKYESADGAIHAHDITVARAWAWQLGLCEGATFTVLYDRKHTGAHTPYFQITDAEIVGAMGATVTPP